MNGLPKIVFSRALERAEWKNTKLVKGNAASEVRELKRQGERNMFVFGSANLSTTLMEQGLFDEYRLGIVPVVLGSGKPLFGRNLSRLSLKLLEVRPLGSGCHALVNEHPESAVNKWPTTGKSMITVTNTGSSLRTPSKTPASRLPTREPSPNLPFRSRPAA